jgi:hypothetical protein
LAAFLAGFAAALLAPPAFMGLDMAAGTGFAAAAGLDEATAATAGTPAFPGLAPGFAGAAA